MPAGKEREALLRVADRLCAELGRGGGEREVPGGRSSLSGDAGRCWGILSEEDESLVVAMRLCLARVAAAVRAATPGHASQGAVSAALDGAEMVIRGEIVSGNAEQLPSLMPSFVFLVTLPIVEQNEALQLSRRTSELVEEVFGGEGAAGR